ncbi:uncharacterized protein MYCFIDRAFT_211559 [Pseudocercospora fijiensis CIRAD86]|uniref:Uncharacterized protein n=1 Tax=Pseudocercospora fijiensis (strain CIRAD86) TaxID=383855 RepID=M2YWS3_PSEFD|nr:uncharacterized protein MYCFIDRAFT_211559 [Pseudocercospora fijiensis CIRAD86]EME82165.1 hypothetical protein MYCFIDRAFT_211559 [Pseudocercospora fijiensis CIRAD86]
MFPIDSMQAQYFEEREQAEAAKRLAHIQEQRAKAQTAAVQSALNEPRAQRSQAPRSLSHAHLQPMTSPNSSTVLGNIFHGFARGTSPAKSASSGSSTPATTPPVKVMTQADIERMMEKKKDADYVGSSPGWW